MFILLGVDQLEFLAQEASSTYYMRHLISFSLLGALAGWVASNVKVRNAQMGILANIIVGIVGAIIGGYLTEQMAVLYGVIYAVINLLALLGAVVGSVILLFVAHLLWPQKVNKLPEPDHEIRRFIS